MLISHDEEFTDVTLAWEDDLPIEAHKAILVGWSPQTNNPIPWSRWEVCFLPEGFPLTLKTYSRACGCPNKVVYGFSMMLSGESPSMLFDLGLTRFEANYNPHLIYDASCLAKEYRYNRELEGSCLSPSPPTEGYICDATCSSDASIATTFISKIWVQICWQICSTK